MKEKAIIIVAAGLLQFPALKIAREIGYKVLATDINPNAPGFKFADEVGVISTTDVEGNIDFAEKMTKKYDIHGVFTEGADISYTVAKVAEFLGLPGVNPQAALAAKNKAIMRRKFKKHGVPIPDFAEITTLSEAEKFLEGRKLPMIIKAVDNSASRGSTIIHNMSQVNSAIELARNYSTTKSAMIEEFLVGTEQSVETVVYDGTHHRCGIVDRHFMRGDYSIETGHTNPSNLPNDIQEKIYEVTRAGAEALGISFGAAKSDIILTDIGPYILELTARLSGGFHCQYTTPLALGMDVIRATMEIHLGKEFNFSLIEPKFHKYSTCLAKFPDPGEVISIKGENNARRSEGMKKLFILIKEGVIIPSYTNCADRIAYFITIADSYEKSIKLNEMAQSKLIIETKPVDELKDESKQVNSLSDRGVMVDFYKKQ